MFLPAYNEGRDRAKVLSLTNAAEIDLVAHSGASFLAIVGHRFRQYVERSLSAGGKMRIVLQYPWSESGFFIAMGERHSSTDVPDPVVRQVLQDRHFGSVDSLALVSKSTWHSLKQKSAIEGYRQLRRQYPGKIEVRSWLYEMPATVLITEHDCYWEPYVSVDLQERLRREMLTFELHCDSSAHLYNHAKSYFQLLWQLSHPWEEMDSIEAVLKDRLSVVMRPPRADASAVTRYFAAGHGLIRRDGRFLVMRRSSVNDYMPGKWDLPGGTVESGETVETALIREIGEETGLTVSIVRPLHIFTNRDQCPARQTFQTVFLCDYTGGDVRLNKLEHDDFAWLTWDELKTRDLIAFTHSLTKALPGPPH